MSKSSADTHGYFHLSASLSQATANHVRIEN